MNKKHWLRSALSLLMALCLVLGTPMAALAAESDYCGGEEEAKAAVAEAKEYGSLARQGVSVMVDVIKNNEAAQAFFQGSSSLSFVKTLAISMIKEELDGADSEKLMRDLGFEPTDENKDIVADELYHVACVHYDEEHRSGGGAESANRLACIELIRFVLVETKGYSNANAQTTAELYWELYQTSETQDDVAALAKALDRLAKPHADNAPKDHKCDTCSKELSVCADGDKNHKCDICGASMGEHADTDKNHKCNYCNEVMSECADASGDGDHDCDYCGKKDVSYCIDADKDRTCDECGKTLCETCVDKNPADHVCDVCRVVLGTCVDEKPKDHKCDVCGKELSKCEDTDSNHQCDYCGTELSKCKDANKDHNCDYCGKELTKCEEGEDKDHKCDVCSVILSECSDTDKNHKCDICTAALSKCEDKNEDQKCDYCGKELHKCADENKDHKCDACGKELTKCADADKNHLCDTCGKELSKCEDADKNHKCEYCGDRISACEDADKNGKCDICGEQIIAQKVITRISGKERTATARKIADEVKSVLKAEKFDAIVYASGDAFPDALTGTYLANAKNAPILLYRASGAADNLAYIKANLAEGGVVYILGGEKAVPASVEADLKAAGIKAERLSGKTRFETNIEILDETGFDGGETVLVCTGYEYADSLSASATGMPILLVNNAAGKLTDAQVTYLKGLDAKCEFVIIGGEGAVSAALAKELAAYDVDSSVARLSGKTRYETSALLAATYLPKAEKAILAYGREFADGLCGGSLGYALEAPIILVESSKASVAAEYVAKMDIIGGYVLGGTARVADTTVRTAFGLEETDLILAK